MGSKTLADFRQAGSIRTAPQDRTRIQAWLQDAVGKLQDAGLEQATLSTRLSAAYDAVFSCALAVINALGHRIDSGDGHHKIAIEILASVLGYSEIQHEELQVVRENRNLRYDGRPPNENQLREAREWAARVLDDVGDWFSRRHPALLKP